MQVGFPTCEEEISCNLVERGQAGVCSSPTNSRWLSLRAGEYAVRAAPRFEKGPLEMVNLTRKTGVGPSSIFLVTSQVIIASPKLKSVPP